VLEVRKTEAKMKLSALENPTFTFNLTRIRVVTYLCKHLYKKIKRLKLSSAIGETFINSFQEISLMPEILGIKPNP
jgi:hypothetical protein